MYVPTYLLGKTSAGSRALWALEPNPICIPKGQEMAMLVSSKYIEPNPSIEAKSDLYAIYIISTYIQPGQQLSKGYEKFIQMTYAHYLLLILKFLATTCLRIINVSTVSTYPFTFPIILSHCQS